MVDERWQAANVATKANTVVAVWGTSHQTSASYIHQASDRSNSRTYSHEKQKLRQGRKVKSLKNKWVVLAPKTMQAPKAYLSFLQRHSSFGLVMWRYIVPGMTCWPHLLIPPLLAYWHLDREIASFKNAIHKSSNSCQYSDCVIL